MGPTQAHSGMVFFVHSTTVQRVFILRYVGYVSDQDTGKSDTHAC